VLEFATIEGARTIGLSHKTGSLTPGKEADLITLRTDRLNVFPLNDPIGAVVVGADTGNVDSVFVAGRAMKRNGQLLNVNLERAAGWPSKRAITSCPKRDLSSPSFEQKEAPMPIVNARYVSHVALKTPDVERQAAFYTSVVGLARRSEMPKDGSICAAMRTTTRSCLFPPRRAALITMPWMWATRQRWNPRPAHWTEQASLTRRNGQAKQARDLLSACVILTAIASS